MVRTGWRADAACRVRNPDALFVTGAAQQQAKAVCQNCLVRPQCLALALDDRIEHGVWGGMTERERRDVLRRSPDVRSWFQFLVQAA